MKTRIITALLIIVVVVPPLVFGGVLLDILIAGIIFGAGYELLMLNEKQYKYPFYVKPLAILFVGLAIFLDNKYLFPLIGLSILLNLSIPVFHKNFKTVDAFMTIGYIVAFTLIGKSFIQIYDLNPYYIWYIILATYLCDTAAYFCGRFFGKHKLNERISPKKTWEGSIGGWIVGGIGASIFAYCFIPSMSILQILIYSFVLSATGQIGDLVFSSIKRDFKIKDFSNLLPGHGGILDRIDSLVFNFLCFSLLMVVMVL